MAVTIINRGSVVAKANLNQSVLNIRWVVPTAIGTTPIIAVDGPLFGIGVGPQSDFSLYSVAYAEELASVLQLAPNLNNDPFFDPFNPGAVPSPPATNGTQPTGGPQTQGFSPQAPWYYPVNPDNNNPFNPQFNTGQYVIGIAQSFDPAYVTLTQSQGIVTQQAGMLDLFLLTRPGTNLPKFRVDKITSRSDHAPGAMELPVAAALCYGRRRTSVFIRNNAGAGTQLFTWRVEGCSFPTNDVTDLATGTLVGGKGTIYTTTDHLIDAIRVYITGTGGGPPFSGFFNIVIRSSDF